MTRRVHGGQTEIPVPNEIGRPHAPDVVFAETFGEAKLAEQRAAYERERACTCGSPHPHRWGLAHHSRGCPRAGKRF